MSLLLERNPVWSRSPLHSICPGGDWWGCSRGSTMDSDLRLDRRGGTNGQVTAIIDCNKKITKWNGKSVPFFYRDATGQSPMSLRAVSSSPHPQRAAHSPWSPAHYHYLKGGQDHQRVKLNTIILKHDWRGLPRLMHTFTTLSEKSACNKECLLVKPLAKMTNYFLFLVLWMAMDSMDTITFVIHASHGFPQFISYFIWYAHYLALLLW